MSQPPGNTNLIETKVHWIFCLLFLLFGVLFCLMELSEFYSVAIGGQGDAHPFGYVNETPWYYRSEAIYRKYTLTNGLAFLAATLFTFTSIIRRKKKLSLIGAAVFAFLLLTHFINMASYQKR